MYIHEAITEYFISFTSIKMSDQNLSNVSVRKFKHIPIKIHLYGVLFI